MIKNLKVIRNRLLEMADINLYRDIVSFMNEPEDDKIFSLISRADIQIKEVLEKILYELVDTFETDNPRYRNEILYGQQIIWGRVFDCYKKLYELRSKINGYRICFYDDDYLKATSEVKKMISFYSEAHVFMSRFEEALGIDRYLDNLANMDVIPLENIILEIKCTVEKNLKVYKSLFIEKWSTTNISKIIMHEIVRYDGNNQICTLFQTGNKKTVLFIIDGFGYVQYLWHKGINNNITTFTYNENIFSWLADKGLLKEYILGSAYVTDTGAGLAQIFIGAAADKTGIISSKACRNSDHNLIETKKIDKISFKNTYDTSLKSITDLVSVFSKKSNVYYCSRYNSNKVSGFSDFIFSGADIQEVIPSERVFGFLREDLLKQNSGLDVVYMTGIDNSGHTMGAFSKFEKYEHEKFNILLRNFLVESAINNPELFDDKTTLLITADHGMAESSKVMISRKIIKDRLNLAGIHGCQLIENNRALLIYGISPDKYKTAEDCLNKIFSENEINYDTLVKGSDEYTKFYDMKNTKLDDIKPDMVVRCIGDALFYSQDKSEHLLHFGGHGGGSVNEIFVPLLEITLSNKLLESINERFINII